VTDVSAGLAGQVAARVALLGDSIAWGQGAAHEDDRLAARLERGLAEHSIWATTRVFAVPGARSSGLGGQVDRALAWCPDVSVVIIGANDLTHLVPTADVIADFETAVGRLRADGGEVVVAPAPDLSTVAHVPVGLRPLVQNASAELRRRQIAAALALGARVADADAATAQAFRSDAALFAADRFHPSSAGYAVIATTLLPQVTAALSTHPA
jgi:lysophospholipase L1-like esterase